MCMEDSPSQKKKISVCGPKAAIAQSNHGDYTSLSLSLHMYVYVHIYIYIVMYIYIYIHTARYELTHSHRQNADKPLQAT